MELVVFVGFFYKSGKIMKFKLIIVFVFCISSLYSGEWRIMNRIHNVEMRTLQVSPNGTCYFFDRYANEKAWTEVTKTIDDGKTRETLFLMNTNNLDSAMGYATKYFHTPMDFQVLNDSLIYLFFDGVRLFLKSTDGGENWEIKELSSQAPSTSEYYYRTKKIGYAILYDNNRGIIRYYDDGWGFRITNNDYEDLDYIKVSDDTTSFKVCGWFENTFYLDKAKREYTSNLGCESIADFYSILKSTDRGKTWKEYPNSDSVIYRKITFVNENLGFVWGAQADTLYPESDYNINVIYRTTDGGESWENILYRRDSTKYIGIDEFHYLDSSHYVATPVSRSEVEPKGKSYQFFYHTSNAGKTWELQFFDRDIANDIYGYIEEWEPMDCLQGYYPDRIYCMVWKWLCKYFPDDLTVPFAGNNLDEKQFSVYPNPAKTGEVINLEPAGNFSGRAEIKIYTIRGELIESFGAYFLGGNSIQFILGGDYHPGTYVIGIEIPGQPPAYEIIVIE